MRIGGISSPGLSRAARRVSSPFGEPALEETRALIAIEPAAPSEPPLATMRHPAAPFLAQLIATRMQVPQTRARRRAEPEEAVTHYATATALRAGQPLRAFKRA